MVAWQSDRSGGAPEGSLLTGSRGSREQSLLLFLSDPPASPGMPQDACTPPSPSSIKRLREVRQLLTRSSHNDAPRTGDAVRAASRLSTVVVHLICNQGVVGSNPTAGTNEYSDLAHFLFSF